MTATAARPTTTVSRDTAGDTVHAFARWLENAPSLEGRSRLEGRRAAEITAALDELLPRRADLGALTLLSDLDLEAMTAHLSAEAGPEHAERTRRLVARGSVLYGAHRERELAAADAGYRVPETAETATHRELQRLLAAAMA